MNIGIVTTWFERGAAYVSKQFRDILDEEADVFVYARGGEEFAIGNPNWDHDYVTWGKPPKTFAFTDINLDDFRQWLITEKIDLVLFNEQKIWAPVLLCREMNIKVGSYIDYYTEQSVPHFALYDFLVCNTRRHESAFIWHPQCLYIPWGTDTELYQYDETKDTFDGEVRFFHSAGMSPYRKGTDMLIKAFAKLTGKAKLVIHSQVSLSKQFPDLADILDDLTKQQKLELHEYTVSAPGLYHLGDVYVYPSRLDGIGLTILEAGAAGLPIIVPDNGPMNEFLSEGFNGRSAEVNKLWSRWDGYYWPQCEVDIDSLAAAMQHYVDDALNMKTIKKQCRDYALENFDWNKNTHALNELFRQVQVRDASELKDVIKQARDYDAKLFARHPKSRKQIFLDTLKTEHPGVFSTLQSIKRFPSKLLGK